MSTVISDKRNILIYYKSGCWMEYIAKALAKNISKRGFNVIMLDVNDKNYLYDLQNIYASNDIYFSIGQNNFGINVTLSNGKFLYECWDIPHITLLGDAPYNNQAMKNFEACKCNNLIIGVRDKTHVECLKYSNLSGMYKAAVFTPLFPYSEYDEKILDNEREIDILYRASYYRELDRSVWHREEFNTSIINLLDDVADISETMCLGVLDSFKYALKCRNLDEEYYLPNLYKYFVLMYQYIKTSRRSKLIENVIKLGYTIDVCSDTWRKSPYAGQLRIHDVDYAKSDELNKKAKIVLSDMAEFNYGAHDRVFDAVFCGSAVISEYSEYLNNNFINGVDLEMFKWKEIDTIDTKIKKLLNDDVVRKAMVYSCATKINKYHTAKYCSDIIFNAVELLL